LLSAAGEPGSIITRAEPARFEEMMDLDNIPDAFVFAILVGALIALLCVVFTL